MVFHSINISKVILNSFHFFGSLDYVMESFVLLVGIFIIGVGKTFFFFFKFCMGLVSFDDSLWMLPLMAKRACIKDGFHDVHALFHIVVHSVHTRCLM